MLHAGARAGPGVPPWFAHLRGWQRRLHLLPARERDQGKV
jgi:hypothetical protein